MTLKPHDNDAPNGWSDSDSDSSEDDVRGDANACAGIGACTTRVT